MSLMRAIRFHKFGGPQVLQIDNIPKPSYQNHQVLIKVKSIGINPVETYFRDGIRDPKLPLPHILGHDGAGIIENLGKDVQTFHIGQKVAFLSMKSNPKHGSYAEYTTVDAEEVWPLSEKLTFNQGAALGTPYFTAYRAIVTKGKAQKGETIFIHGASGAVGIAALQISKQLGLKIIATAGTSDGCQLVKDNGADYVFNHNNESYISEIKALIDSIKIDIIVEMLANVNLGNDLPLLGKYGRVLIVGSRGEVKITPRDIMANEASIQGVMLYNVTSEEYKTTVQLLTKGIEDGWVKPIVGKEYSINQVQNAHHDIIHGKGAKGKIVVNLDLV